MLQVYHSIFFTGNGVRLEILTYSKRLQGTAYVEDIFRRWKKKVNNSSLTPVMYVDKHPKE
jgi:hypothetical protein